MTLNYMNNISNQLSLPQ